MVCVNLLETYPDYCTTFYVKGKYFLKTWQDKLSFDFTNIPACPLYVFLL